MVTLEEDELFYEANDLDEDLSRKLHRRVRRNNQGQVVAFTQTTVNTNLGEEQISTKKDDLKKMTWWSTSSTRSCTTMPSQSSGICSGSSSIKLKPHGL